MNKKHITFSIYAGNHDAGKDQIIHNPHNIPLDLALYAYSLYSFNWLESDQYSLKKLSGDDFETTIKLGMTPDHWAIASQKWDRLQSIAALFKGKPDLHKILKTFADDYAARLG